MVSPPAQTIASSWNDERPNGLDPVDLLVYQSNLLGSDTRITNFGGGNTSAKISMPDPLTGEQVEVLWVKGSGGDLGSMRRSGLASLYLSKLLALETKYARSPTSSQCLTEDEIVDMYPYCTFGMNPTVASIDTPLHAFVGRAFVNHFHADSCIAIAAAADSERLTQECFGEVIGWVPWKRPGFELGLMCRDALAANPTLRGLIMGSHGIICWADDQREVYELSLRLVNQAQAFIAGKRPAANADAPSANDALHPFGRRVADPSLPNSDALWPRILPTLRGRVAFDPHPNPPPPGQDASRQWGGTERLIAHVDESDAVLDFLSREKMPALARMGTSCPDHFLRTKIAPLVLPIDEILDLATPNSTLQTPNLDRALASYRESYAAYYARCKRPDSPPMRNPNPSVVLLPGLGMVAFGKNKQEARVTAEFYCRAIEVMRGAEALSKYTALPEQEAFDIEYWWLEENKLRRQPPEKPLSRHIALVTGAAQGIGRATALKLAEQGACVAMLDLNRERLDEAMQEGKAKGLGDQLLAIECDVTLDGSDKWDDSDNLDGSHQSDLSHAFEATVKAFGGLDIVVANAGNARRGTIADTTDEDYDFLADLLMKAYFRTLREASRIMIEQGTGGSIVVVASKNAVATGSNAAVYSAAKAFELHLMRTAANDLAKHQIRANAVNPDAVLQGSGIWTERWREQTARSLGIKPEELEDHYRKRSMLGLEVRPEDIADAVFWLCSRASSRTTGAVIPVDAGVREGFLR